MGNGISREEEGITDELNNDEFTIDQADCLPTALALVDAGDDRKYLWRLSIDSTGSNVYAHNLMPPRTA